MEKERFLRHLYVPPAPSKREDEPHLSSAGSFSVPDMTRLSATWLSAGQPSSPAPQQLDLLLLNSWPNTSTRSSLLIQLSAPLSQSCPSLLLQLPFLTCSISQESSAQPLGSVRESSPSAAPHGLNPVLCQSLKCVCVGGCLVN